MLPTVDSIRLDDIFNMPEGIIYRWATKRDMMRLRKDETRALLTLIEDSFPPFVSVVHPMVTVWFVALDSSQDSVFSHVLVKRCCVGDADRT